MKYVKGIFIFLLFMYAFCFAVDYVAAMTNPHADEQFCQHWIRALPLWAHFLMPGYANACIDKGYFP